MSMRAQVALAKHNGDYEAYGSSMTLSGTQRTGTSIIMVAFVCFDLFILMLAIMVSCLLMVQ